MVNDLSRIYINDISSRQGVTVYDEGAPYERATGKSFRANTWSLHHASAGMKVVHVSSSRAKARHSFEMAARMALGFGVIAGDMAIKFPERGGEVTFVAAGNAGVMLGRKYDAVAVDY